MIVDVTTLALAERVSERQRSEAEGKLEQLHICERIEALTFDEMCALVDRTFEYQRTHLVPF